MDKKVSKKKYQEACKNDPVLPLYEEGDFEPEEPQVKEMYQKCDALLSDYDRHEHDEFINRLLRKPNRGEVRHWLRGDERRFIGEMTHEDSARFVEAGYKAGATKIIAVEIEEETTNCLIVYLPPVAAQHKRVFKWNGEHAQELGFDPYDDWGQNELFVYFS